MIIVPLLFLTVVVSITTAFPLEDALTITPFRRNWEDTPNPQKQHEDCGRRLPSHVCDPDGILKPGDADKLDHFIGRIKNDTSCFCSQCYEGRPGGITMSVAMVKRVYRHYHEEVSQSVANFASHLRKSWNLGMCDDDVLIVISTEDRQSYIESGKTVATAISREETDRIFMENKLHFETGSYYQGLESIIESYYDVLRQVRHSSPMAGNDEVKDSSIGLAVGLVVGFIVLGAALGFIVITIRRRRAANSDKIHYDSTKTKSSKRRDSPPRPIVKKTVDFFPTTDYQKCKVEDNGKEEDNDELDSNSQQAKAQLYQHRGKELSMVVEESERGDEEVVSQVSETSTQEAITPEIQETTTDNNDNIKKVL